MSLINDALKRAKAAQQQVSQPPPDLPLRPVEPGQQHARHNLGLLLPAALALVALLALFLVWQWARTRQPGGSADVAARAVVPAVPAQPDWSVQPAPAPAPVAAPAEAPVANSTAEPAASPLDDAPETDVTAVAPIAPPVAAPAPPKPAPLRLQGILFNPQRPAAMISGKTVFVGDKLGDLRVVAIGQNSATLANSARTNVLFLYD
jgi:hypothetical protein